VDAGYTQAVQVTGKGSLSLHLLRCGILGTANQCSRVQSLHFGELFGSPKIDQNQPKIASATNNIGGFDVAVDDLAIVEKLQEGQQFFQNLAHLPLIKRNGTHNFLCQSPTVDPLLHQKGLPVPLKGIQQSRNLGMFPQFGKPLSLPLKKLESGLVVNRAIGQELLDNAEAGAILPLVYRQQSFAKSPLPQQFENTVAIVEE
jgi:hypothetical protein